MKNEKDQKIGETKNDIYFVDVYGNVSFKER